MSLFRRFSLYCLAAAFFVCLLLAIVFYLDCFSSIDNGGQRKIVFLHANAPVSSLVRQFKQWKWVRSELSVNAYLKVSGLGPRLHAGQYWFRPGMSVRDLFINMSQSKGVVYHDLKIIPGETFVDILYRLKHANHLIDDVNGRSTAQIKSMLNSPHTNLEGLFSPDTYQYVYHNKASNILRVAYRKMQKNLSRVWANRDKSLPYRSPYELLIAASLIQAESMVDKERPLVSSVLVNRLRKNMLLQFDPTILYGLHRRLGGDISRADLIKFTPYNTYRVKGLPPTPIDNPGLSSLEAAAHPAKTDYLYFVLDPKSNIGRHVFSTNLADHDKAVENYIRGG